MKLNAWLVIGLNSLDLDINVKNVLIIIFAKIAFGEVGFQALTQTLISVKSIHIGGLRQKVLDILCENHFDVFRKIKKFTTLTNFLQTIELISLLQHQTWDQNLIVMKIL